MRRGGSEGPRRHRGGPSKRTGGFISIGLVLALTVGLVGTVLGVGATSRSLDVSDGNIWLWSSKPAQVSRVNSNSGRVDQNQPLLDSRGHHVEVTQNDKYLLLHDLDTGKITSVDLSRMGFTGSIQVDKGPGVRVALSGDKAVLIDQKTGKIRGFDPDNLRDTKAVLQLPAPLAGGDFDAKGALWVGLPSQGTVVSVDVSATSATIASTKNAAAPGHPMALTVLDNGALAADRSGDTVAVVTDTVVTHTTSEKLTDATLPSRTVGALAAITLPKTGRVVPIAVGDDDKDGSDKADTHRIGGFALPAGVTAGAATPFSGRIYVPDAKRHLVYVFAKDGKSLGTLGLAGATGPLELQVREDHLMINAPDSSVARVVDTDGVTRIVDKYQTNQQDGNGDLAVIAAPAPGKSGAKQSGKHGKGKAGDSDQDKAANGPPGPPIPVTALAGSHTVNLSWPQPATNGAPLTRYDISWDGGHKSVDGGTRSLRVDNLHNGTQYSFGVTATNKFGTGPQALSDPVTPGSKTPDVPGGVSAAVDAKSGAVTVTWKESDEADRYVVTPSNGGPEQTVSGTSTAVNGLTPGQRYTFTVTALSQSGVASQPSAPSNEVTPFAAPDAPVVGTGTVAKDSIQVTWQPAADNGSPVTKYTVTIDGGQPATEPAGATSHTFGGLQPNTQHTFAVVATNQAGDGPAGQANATSSKPPAPTVSVSVTGQTTNSVTVAVNASASATSCTVSLTGRPSQSCAVGTTSSHTFTGLAPSSSYQASATVGDQYGQNGSSGSVNASTTTVSTVNSCTKPQSDCTVGIYSIPWQPDGNSSTRKVGDWAQGQSVDVMCRANGQSIYAYVQNGNRRSTVWLQLKSGGYVPWAWSNMAEGARDDLPTCS